MHFQRQKLKKEKKNIIDHCCSAIAAYARYVDISDLYMYESDNDKLSQTENPMFSIIYFDVGSIWQNTGVSKAPFYSKKFR